MTQCVTSLGTPYRNGYRQLYHPVKKKKYAAHRVVFEMFWGPIPHNCVIMHKCDNRACTNINHPVASTQGHNLADMYSKGRQGDRDLPVGEDHHMTTVTQGMVDELRATPYFRGLYFRTAVAWNVSRQTVRNIYLNKTWTDDTYRPPYLKDLV